MRAILIALSITLAAPTTAWALHPRLELSQEEAKTKNIRVQVQDVRHGSEHVWVTISAPLRESDVKLDSIGFSLKAGDKTVVSSNIPFLEVEKGHASGRFYLHQDQLKNTTLTIDYFEGISGFVYSIDWLAKAERWGGR